MKAGHVVTIRVNPRDCQSVLDVLDAAGVPRKALSFAQCVSLAMGCLLETARRGNVIPEPDEFEYLNRLSQYVGKGKVRKTVRMSEALHDLGGAMRAPVLGGGEEGPSAAQARPADLVVPEAVDTESPEYKEAQRTLTNLLVRKEQADDDPSLWNDAYEREFQRCYRVVYPNG